MQRLSKAEQVILQKIWEGLSYAEIANQAGYNTGHIRNISCRLWQSLSHGGEKVTKKNLYSVLRCYQQQHAKEARTLVAASTSAAHQSWGEAIDVSLFYGRTAELLKLEQWIVTERCRLVAVLGMGGIGKTALSVKLAQQLQGQFEYLIWRSLRDAPPLADLLTDSLKLLSVQKEVSLPETVGGKISRLLEYLQKSRCLLILDNFDALLQPGKRIGIYRDSYEGYGELLKRVGEIPHQSCMILTSREKPLEVGALEGEILPVRTLLLSGLEVSAGQDILLAKGLFGSTSETTRLIEYYRGNPLALKIVATSIRDLFTGSITSFLDQNTVIFNGTFKLLEQQIERLSDLEKQVMYWLAINREFISVDELQVDIVPAVSRGKLIEALESLNGRSLIEKSAFSFTQQPVLMEYMTDQLSEQLNEELNTERIYLLNRYALLKATAKDYIRDSQIRMILKPLLEKLNSSCGSPQAIEQKLQHLLVKLQEEFARLPGYGGGNILNLFRQLEINLTGYDFSNLIICQAYLQDVNLHQVNFAHAELTNCVFAQTFGGITSIAFSSDGQLQATSDTNGKIQIWTTDGKLLFVCKGHDSWVWFVAFSPNNQVLASCSQDHTIRLWDVKTGQCLRTLLGHTSIVTSLAFHPHDQVLASSSEDRSIKLWDVNTGQCLSTLQEHQGCVWTVTFSPDGQTLVSGGEDDAIKMWDSATGQCLKTLQGHLKWIKSVAVSPDGITAASGSFDQTVKLWNIHTGDCFATLQGHIGPVVSVAFSSDGQVLASGSYDRTVKL